ncbi:diacylglycerol kinase (ATP) [Litoreibacter ascidiaceicola]|uniref:Diacylglycerol kinase n=1 Tax=Litoreibacter ascidiaceicola TaxID=1486859 RepID=A0A1M4YEE0_9RHOB|nr:diacylglycerol kinase [Litoreibacter ascidiaceicola]SHF04089.1 diacylglycerol kinase (ATP) [Litoreibacter ascidiaceicola]
MNRCLWSWEGVVAIWRGEPSFRFWFVLNICSVGLAFWLPLSAEGRALIVALGLVLLAAEALNTGVEAAVDRSGIEHDALGKYAKDAASAGVALSAIAAGVAWVILIVGLI